MPGSWRPLDVLQFVFVLLCVQHSITEDDRQGTGQTYSTAVGRSVMLPCFVSNNCADVWWTFRETESSETVVVYSNGAVADRWTSRAGMEPVVDGDCSLIVTSLERSDSGTYACDANDGSGVAFSYTLVVTGSNRGPVVSVTAVVGSPVAFDCRIANGSLIRWHHNSSAGDKLMVHNGRKPNSKLYEQSRRFHFYNGTNRSVFFIDGTAESDTGTFTCSPLHTAVDENRLFALSVTGGSGSRYKNGSVVQDTACNSDYVCRSTLINIAVVEAILAFVFGCLVVLLIFLCVKKCRCGCLRNRRNRNEQSAIEMTETDGLRSNTTA